MIGRRDAMGGDVWLYPLRFGETLTSNDWIEWPFHKVLDAPFIAHVLQQDARDAGFAAFLLFNAAFRQDPAGTLPDDDVELARLAGFGVDVDRWRALRDFALWGWGPVAVPAEEVGGELGGRLGHVDVAELAARSVRERSKRRAKSVAGNLAVDKSRVRKALIAKKRERYAADDALVGEIVRFLREAELFINPDNCEMARTSLLGLPKVVPLRGGGDG